MNILLLLVPLSLVLLVVMISAFAWAVRNGQFDDLDTPPLDVLADRQPAAPPAHSPTPPAAPAVPATDPADAAPRESP